MSERRSEVRPFLLIHGERLQPEVRPRVRFDDDRQLAQVLVGGSWVDALDADAAIEAGTKITDVKRETTDDN